MLAASPFEGKQDQRNSFGGFDWNMDYTHQFSKNHQITFSAQWSHAYTTTGIHNDFGQIYNSEVSHNDNVNNEYTMQADYQRPIGSAITVEGGVKSIFRAIQTNFQEYRTPAVGLPADTNQLIFDPLNSNDFRYRQYVEAGYLSARISLSKSFTLLSGLRLENTLITGKPINTGYALSAFSNTYLTWVPSFTLQHLFPDGKTLKLTYSKRISRPSLTYLNPFINTGDIQNQSTGNPMLRPESTQKIELNYDATISNGSFDAGIYSKYSHSLIDGVTTLLPQRNALLTRFENVGNTISYGLSVNASVTLLSKLLIRANIELFSYRIQTSKRLLDALADESSALQIQSFFSASYTFNHQWVAEVFMLQNNSEKTLQGTLPAFFAYNVAVRKQLLNRRLSLGLKTTTPFTKDQVYTTALRSPNFTANSIDRIPFRSFGVTLSYKFGNLKFSNSAPNSQKINNDDLKSKRQN